MTHRHWGPADYQSPHWRGVRQAAFERSDGLCQFCGMAEATEGHHLEYREPADMRPGMVTGLCGLCHAMATSIRSLARVLANKHPGVAWAEAATAIQESMPGILAAVSERLAESNPQLTAQDHSEPPRGTIGQRPRSGESAADYSDRPLGRPKPRRFYG